nr:MAG TPA: hypothetical protein [Caudoviricetes sp.]
MGDFCLNYGKLCLTVCTVNAAFLFFSQKSVDKVV